MPGTDPRTARVAVELDEHPVGLKTRERTATVFDTPFVLALLQSTRTVRKYPWSLVELARLT